MRYPGRTSKRPYKKRAYRRRRAAPKKKQSFAARVNKLIHAQIENKLVSTYAANQNMNYAGPATSPSYINLTPSPSYGANQNQRLANEIRIMKAHIRGYVNLSAYNATFNPGTSPVYVKMWLCRRKQTNIAITGNPAGTDWSNFFQSGGSSVGFQANILDMCFKTNNDYWTVLATKTFQLASNAVVTSAGIYGASSRVSRPFSFTFGKHLAKIKYNDATTYPTNKELFLVMQAVAADGTSPSAAQYCEYHYNVEWEFEDA